MRILSGRRIALPGPNCSSQLFHFVSWGWNTTFQ